MESSVDATGLRGYYSDLVRPLGKCPLRLGHTLPNSRHAAIAPLPQCPGKSTLTGVTCFLLRSPTGACTLSVIPALTKIRSSQVNLAVTAGKHNSFKASTI